MRGHPLIALIFLFLLLLTSCRQGNDKEGNTTSSKTVDSVFSMARDYARRSEYDSARIWLKKTDSLASTAGNRLIESDVLANYGWIHEQSFTFDSALFYYNKSLSVAREINRSDATINRLKSIGQTYRKMGRFDKAVESYEESLDLAADINDSINIADLSNSLGNILSDLEEYEECIKYYRRAVSIWTRYPSRVISYSIALHNLASALTDLDSMDKSIPLLYRTLEIKDSLGREKSKAYTLSALGTAYRKKGDFNKAKEMLFEAYEIRVRLNDRPGIAHALFRLGMINTLQGDLDEASKRLEEAERLALELENPELLRNVLEEKKRLYKTSDRLREWVATDEVFDILTDSLQREQRLRVQEAQSKAELQREQQRTALAEQGAQIARLETESERQKGELRLVLIFVALLALAVIGWQLWQIRKRNSSLIALNNRIRLITDNAFHSQKNALGLISALLRSKARQSEHDKELEVLRDVEGKIEALGGVAKYLFQTRIADNTEVAARIQLASYLESLINDTFESVAGDNGSLEMNLEEVSVSSTEALNIGLIANEAVTNFSKYAASQGGDKLKIETKAEVEKLLFQVSDNGPGFPEDFKISKSNGFGMQMIANLVEDMEGKLSMVREEGWTLIRVHIPLSH